MENVLEIKNLSKKYKNFTLNNINLTLDKGFIMGIIGENGAGKTTLIKLIMNLVNKSEGSIRVFGMDYIKNEKEIKDRIGFVYDQFYGYDYLSLQDNTNLLAPMYSKWNNEKYKYYINKFSLNEKQKLRELSKGMRMKYSLCLALSHGAELILMDEPTAGLDPIVRNELLDELQDLIYEENISVIISTHITSDLEKIADFITFIKEGEVIFSIPKDDILEEFKIAKGKNEDLNEEVEKLFLGLRKNNYGFEGLTNKVQEIEEALKDKIVLENTSLEKIMLLYGK